MEMEMEKARLLDPAENVSDDGHLPVLGAMPSSIPTAHSRSKPGRKPSGKIFRSMTRSLRRAINDTTKPRSRTNNGGIQVTQRPSRFGKGNHTYEQVAKPDNTVESLIEPVIKSLDKHHHDETVKVATAKAAAIHKQQLLEKAHETKMKAIHGHRDRKDLSMPDLDEAHVRLRAELDLLKTHAWFTDAAQKAVKDFDHARHEIALMLHHQLTYHLSDELENLHQAIKRLSAEIVHCMTTAAQQKRLMDLAEASGQKALLVVLWNMRDSMFTLHDNLRLLMHHQWHISRRKTYETPDMAASEGAQRLQHASVDLKSCMSNLDFAGRELAIVFVTLLKCASTHAYPGDMMQRIIKCVVWPDHSSMTSVQSWFATVQRKFHFRSHELRLSLHKQRMALAVGSQGLTSIATRSFTGCLVYDRNDFYPRRLYNACWKLVLYNSQTHHLGPHFYSECGKVMNMVFSDEAWVDLHTAKREGGSPISHVIDFDHEPKLTYRIDNFNYPVHLYERSRLEGPKSESDVPSFTENEAQGCYHAGYWVVSASIPCHDMHSVDLWFA